MDGVEHQIARVRQLLGVVAPAVLDFSASQIAIVADGISSAQELLELNGILLH